ncbi:hypothetical protein HRJ34_15010 [Rhizorhabdus wittichii]|uniref:Uncharacterized protein n=1 Tax=Rhizorhabdus wittichii TaxID=160791 RepID=A0A975CYJ5_9SPHN|nr:hypothetical protein [Rhizorhabdus wittichii]QTH19682.1 hypothetical protein HRJ34_15010 [Rhizorhabdus wittichii]
MNALNNAPWMTGGLFDPIGTNFDPNRYRAVEVRPVTQDHDGCHAHIRGDGVLPHFWGVYLIDAEGIAECVADFATERAADCIAEALMLEYGLSGRSTLRGPITSHDLTEAAQCLWEAVLDAVRGDAQPDDSWQASAKLSCENIGYGEVRRWMLDLAPDCHTAWVRATETEGYDSCFDWEFVPAWLASLDWSDGQPFVRPDAPVKSAPKPSELVAPQDIAAELAERLETLSRAVASPDRSSGNDAVADAADDTLNDALADARWLLARMGVTVEG